MRLYPIGARPHQPFCVSLLAVAVAGWLTAAVAQAAPAAAPATTPAADPAASAAPAASAPVAYDEPYTINTKLQSKQAEIRRILQAGRFEGDDRTLFDDYHRQYALPRWTDPKNFSILPIKMRRELRGEMQTSRPEAARPREAHDRLGQIALEVLGKMALDNQPPVVRVNALLAIGELNSEEGMRSIDKGTPLADALEPLCKAAQQADLPEYVRAAALVGIKRHAEINAGKSADVRDKITPVALKILDGSSLPKGVSPAGADWLRTQAADVLGALSQAGEKDSVALALAKVAANDQAPVAARAAAARALGHFKYDNGGGDVLVLAASVGHMVQGAANSAHAEWEAAQFPAGIVGQRLLVAVSSAQTALKGTDKDNGLAAAAKDNQAVVIKGMLDQLDKLSELLKKLPTATGGASAQNQGGGAAGRVDMDQLYKRVDEFTADLVPKTDKAP